MLVVVTLVWCPDINFHQQTSFEVQYRESTRRLNIDLELKLPITAAHQSLELIYLCCLFTIH